MTMLTLVVVRARCGRSSSVSGLASQEKPQMHRTFNVGSLLHFCLIGSYDTALLPLGLLEYAMGSSLPS